MDEWNNILKRMKGNFTSQTFSSVFGGSAAEMDGNILRVLVQTEGAAEWANKQLTGRTLEIVRTAKVFNGVTGLIFEYRQPSTARSLPEPDDGEAAIHLELDIEDNGFVMVANYTAIYWQTYLTPGPFLFWVTLRAFAWGAKEGGDWPSIELLATICAGGQRYKLMGRKDRGYKGWIEELAEKGIVAYKRQGRSKHKWRYYFKTPNKLPLMTPTEVSRLPPLLQEKHEKLILKHEEENDFDVAAWRRIKSETFIKPLSFK